MENICSAYQSKHYNSFLVYQIESRIKHNSLKSDYSEQIKRPTHENESAFEWNVSKILANEC